MSMTSADVLDALRSRWPDSEYLTIREAPDGAARLGRKLDALVISLWRSRGYELDGIEIKVSHSDWMREVNNPAKADFWWRHTHRFWVAVPVAIATKVRETLPSTWGLLAVQDGKCKEVVKAPKHQPEPLSWENSIGLMRAACDAGPGALLRAQQTGERLGYERAKTQIERTSVDGRLRQSLDDLTATDILLASPECTTHSQARSNKHRTDLFNPEGDPATERSRATMWDVPRFAEAMANRGRPYQAIVVENVIEIMRWLPIDGWFLAMEKLGYRWRLVSANSMVAWPTPQSRDRWYCVFWRKGNHEPDLELRPPAWCPKCETTIEARQAWKRPGRTFGKYRQQYLYRCATCNGEAAPLVYPAASAIDWTLPAPRIGDRARPLAPATRRRIEIGLERYGAALIQAAGHTYEANGYVRAWPLTRPMPTQRGTLMHGVSFPAFLLDQQGYSGRHENRVHGVDEPLRTVVAAPNHHALATVPPMVVSTTRTHAKAHHRVPRSVEQPMATQTAQLEHGLVIPMRTNATAKPAETDPLATITTSHGGGQTLIVPLRRNGRAVATDEAPLPTVAAAGTHHALVVRNHGGTDKAGPMAKPADEPFGTITGAGNQAVVPLPFTIDYHGNGRATPVDEPLPTQDTRDRHALVEPSIEVDDCGFRMLEPHEIGAAMAFPDTYVVLGNKRQRVRMYGNAVTPPIMQILVDRIVESLA